MPPKSSSSSKTTKGITSTSNGKTPTLDSDLKKLGIKEGIEYYTKTDRKYDTGPIMSSSSWYAAQSQSATNGDEGKQPHQSSSSSSSTAAKGKDKENIKNEDPKDKNSDKLAPDEEMDEKESESQNHKDDAQSDAVDVKPSGGAMKNNAHPHVAESGSGSGSKSKSDASHHDADVSGLDKGSSGKGKRKREPSPHEGGVAGDQGKEGVEEESQGGGKKKKDAYAVHGKIAHASAAARVDSQPPLVQLLDSYKKYWGDDKSKSKSAKGKGDDVENGEAVVYWMRMEDLRVYDNRALHLASTQAQSLGLPLIVLFVITPKEYRAHDRSPRKVDFVLRNLRVVKKRLDELNIPLWIHTHSQNRFALPSSLISKLLPSLDVTQIFGNIEYEVDELRRDIEVVKLGAEAKGKKIKATFVHDRLAVPPGIITSGKGTALTVYSPWQRKWAAHLDANPDLLEEFPEPSPNDKSVRKHQKYGKLFDTEVPDHVGGFECKDTEVMNVVWPEGTENAKKILHNFVHCPASKQYLGAVDPRLAGDENPAGSRIEGYADGRNTADLNSSSRLSPYLAAGVISSRMVLNEAKRKDKKGKLQSGRDSGLGMWVQEVAWRDFYNSLMAEFPRVSMGRPFKENYADIQWDVNEELLQAWKDGKTGYPIIDAAMRQCNTLGWMHNRPRMIVASFLCKHLMLDWRLGEKYFMENFIDGDLAANNGGWQWTASTGSDPQPYFRIFNPWSQSETASPDGSYIRYWVPELSGLSGKAIHNPYESLPRSEFKKLGYPKPIVEHKEARAKALHRYKFVGSREPGDGAVEGC